MSDHTNAPPPPSGGPHGGAGYPGQGGWQGPPPTHPNSTTALVLGILGILACPLLGPFAWVMGGRAVKEIDTSPTPMDGRSNAQAGRVLGIVGTVLLGLAGVGVAALLVVGTVAFQSDNCDVVEDESGIVINC